MNRGVTFSILGGCLLAACDDGSGPGPTTGEVRVVTSTTGSALDPDGYTVTLDGNAGQAVEINGTLTLTDVAPGDHAVALSGVASNCEVGGQHPLAIVVTAGETSEALLTVVCSEVPTTGGIQVTTSTGGVGTDADGYTVVLDGHSVEPIAINGTVELTGVAPGDHTVTLSGLAVNCEIESSHPLEIAVIAGVRTDAPFTVVCFAPARGRLAFSFYEDGSTTPDIYVINADRTGRTRLTRNGAGGPQWSPDGTRIAYVLGAGRIGVMNADGTGHVTLTDGPGDYSPLWSPDGTRIAYIRQPGRIGVINADGTGQITLTDGPVVGVPSWSPDGTRLVFESERDGDEIYVLNTDGTGILQLTDDNELDSDPAWSPDGSRIAFISTRAPEEAEHIFTMSPTGDDIQQITTGQFRYLRLPLWSPDGTQLVYRFGIMPGATGHFQGLQTLNVADGSSGGVFLPDRASGAAWSHDGSLIAYQQAGDIWIVRRDGSGPMNLTQTPQHEEYGPSWAP